MPAATITLQTVRSRDNVPVIKTSGRLSLGTVREVSSHPPLAPSGRVALAPVVERERTFPLTASGILNLGVITERDTVPPAPPYGVVALGAVVERSAAPMLRYTITLGVIVEVDRHPALEVNEPAGPRRYVPGLPYVPDLRVLAQDIRTGRWLATEVSVADLSVMHTLSGPQAITGKLRPQIAELVDAGFAPWATWLHVEDDDGAIRASAILTPPFSVEDDTRSLTSTGISGYAQTQTWDGEYSAYQVDPLAIVRLIWQHILTKPSSSGLGVTVSQNPSAVRIGGYPPTMDGLTGPQSGQETVADGEIPKPYALSWWEGTKCGPEIDELAKQAPFDYREQQAWNADRTAVLHHLELGYPRVGARRTDLRFADGENIRANIATRQGDDQFVTDVRVRGAGEGRAMVLGRASRPSPNQLGIVLDVQDSTVKSTARANSRAAAELRRRSVPVSIEKLLVDAKHPNAPYGSYVVGDDILVQCEVDWIGDLVMWHRILDHTFTPDQEAVALTLAPSSTFRYGSED